MLIEKKYQGTIPTNKILNEKTESATDTYSCEYINGLGSSGSGADDVPINTIVEYDGTEVPDGWEKVEDSGSGESVTTFTPEYLIGKYVASDNWHLTNDNTSKVYPINTVHRQVGSNLTIGNDGIIIGKGINTIEVFANGSYISPSLNTGKVASLQKNDEIISVIMFSTVGTSYNAFFIKGIIDVKENDVIKLCFAGKHDDNVQRNDFTTLTVNKLN